MAVGVLVVEILGASTKGRALLQEVPGTYRTYLTTFSYLSERVLLVQPRAGVSTPEEYLSYTLLLSGGLSNMYVV